MRFLKAIGKGGALVDMNEAVADIDTGAREGEKGGGGGGGGGGR